MVALKGKSDIGNKINTQIIPPLIDANTRLARSDFPDFNDPNKLGQGQEMVERLTNLISMFQKAELDFSKHHAEHDDILGNAYAYLMRHFATESGKSKSQFQTPSEVSRVIAKVIGISPENPPRVGQQSPRRIRRYASACAVVGIVRAGFSCNRTGTRHMHSRLCVQCEAATRLLRSVDYSGQVPVVGISVSE